MVSNKRFQEWENFRLLCSSKVKDTPDPFSSGTHTHTQKKKQVIQQVTPLRYC